MRVWGIIATVLLVAVVGVGVWQYQSLTDQKSKLEADLAAANTARATAEASVAAKTTKISSAATKFDIINKVFAGINGQDESLAVYDKVKALNDANLSADWKAMQDSKPGDNTGNKFITDLLALIAADLK